PFLSALVSHPAVRANAIDTGFIERELKQLAPGGRAPRDIELGAAVGAILREEENAARADRHSPWHAGGWMPVGRRLRTFTFRDRHGGEHKVGLRYGKGPAALLIGRREIAFSSVGGVDASIDLTMHGVKSRVAAIVEGHELYVRTKNGRFEL